MKIYKISAVFLTLLALLFSVSCADKPLLHNPLEYQKASFEKQAVLSVGENRYGVLIKHSIDEGQNPASLDISFLQSEENSTLENIVISVTEDGVFAKSADFELKLPQKNIFAKLPMLFSLDSTNTVDREEYSENAIDFVKTTYQAEIGEVVLHTEKGADFPYIISAEIYQIPIIITFTY